MASRNVGTITAVLRILTADAYRQTENAAAEAGEKAGENFSQAFQRRAEREKFDRMYRRWQRDQRGPVERLGESLGGLFSVAWGRGLTRQGRLWYRAIVGLLEPATALVFGLGGAAVALAGSLGSASLSVGTLVPLVGALGLGVGALLVGFSGITGELEDMNPPLREVVESVKALEPAWAALTEAVQVELWEGVGDAITRVATTVLPQLQEGLVSAAGVINDNLLDALSRIEEFNWSDLFGDLTPILDDMLGAFVEFGEAFFYFMDAAAPAAERVSSALEGVAQRWNDWIQSNPDEINRILQEALDRTTAWGDALGPFGAALQNVFAVGADEADRQLGGIQAIGERFEEWTESVAGNRALEDFFDRSFDALEAFTPALTGLATGLNTLFTDKAISNLESFSEGLGEAFEVIGELFAALGNAGLLEVFGDLLKTASDILTPLVPVIETFATAIGDLLGEAMAIVGPLLADMAETLGGSLQPALEALYAEVLPVVVELFESFAPVMVELAELFAELAPLVADLVIQIAPFLGQILELAAVVLDFVAGAAVDLLDWLSRLPEHVETVGEWFSQLGEWVSSVGESIGEFFTGIGEFFAGVWEGIEEFFAGVGEAITGFFDGIVETFTGWVDGIMELWRQFTEDPLTFIENMVDNAIEKFNELFDRGVQIIGDLVTGVIEFFLTLPGDVAQAVRDMREKVKEWMIRTKDDAIEAVRNLKEKVVDWFNRTRLEAADRIAAMAGQVVAFFVGLPGRLSSGLSNMFSTVRDWFNRTKDSAEEKVGQMVSGIMSWITGLPGRIGSALGGLAASITSKFDVVGRIGGIVSDIVGFFIGMPGRIISALGNIGGRILNTIRNSIPGPLRRFVPGLAAGGLVFGPTTALIGEAGPEAVIPLTRPLSQVDPSVRDMAAQLRGQPRMASGGVAGAGGPVYNVTMNVHSAVADPAAVASQVMNRMTVLAASA